MKIKHVSSDQIAIMLKGSHVAKDYKFDCYWCDDEAQFRLPPMKVVKVLSLFEDMALGYPIACNKPKNRLAINAVAKAIAKEFTPQCSELRGENEVKVAEEFKGVLKQKKGEDTSVTMTGSQS